MTTNDVIQLLQEAVIAGKGLKAGHDTTSKELLLMADVMELCISIEGRLNFIRKNGLPRPEKKPKPKTDPWGTFGRWDYPNIAWKQAPKLDDVDEICQQKMLRDPNSKFWSNREVVVKWLYDKGFDLQ